MFSSPLISLLSSILLFQAAEPVERAADVASQVAIIVNEAVPESVELGRYYASRRGVPETRICRVTTSRDEIISWDEFEKTLAAPLKTFLAGFPDVIYLVPMHGLPLKIAEGNPEDDGKESDGTIQYYVQHRDYACVDREIELLRREHKREAWISSKAWQLDRHLTPDDNLYIVSRLDGPSPDSVRGMIDRALLAEAYGVEGTCLLDTRGMGPGGHGEIDIPMRKLAEVFARTGLPVLHDNKPPVVRLGTYPHTAHYWGWYTEQSEIRRGFRFVPGAVGTHFHSFSANTLRSVTRAWAGPLVAHGITGTWGAVNEPISIGYPEPFTFFDRFFRGYTFGESLEFANKMTSWQAVFVGDPLYAPYAKGMKEIQEGNHARLRDADREIERCLNTGEVAGARRAFDTLRPAPEYPIGGESFWFRVREIRARELSKRPARGTLSALEDRVRRACTARTEAKALTLAREALKMSPENPYAHLLIAGIFFRQGRWTRAAIHAGHSAAVAPEGVRFDGWDGRR